MRGSMKKSLLTSSAGVCILAVFCCALWGSAFPSIKIGYELFGIPAADVNTQILFAGCRFTLAGVLVVALGSAGSRRFLRPEKGNWGQMLRA